MNPRDIKTLLPEALALLGELRDAVNATEVELDPQRCCVRVDNDYTNGGNIARWFTPDDVQKYCQGLRDEINSLKGLLLNRDKGDISRETAVSMYAVFMSSYSQSAWHTSTPTLTGLQVSLIRSSFLKALGQRATALEATQI